MDITVLITNADITPKGDIGQEKINEIKTALEDKGNRLSLVFDHCERLKKLPKDFYKYGTFNNVEFMGCTSLTSLAPKMHVNRTLKIKDCPLITKLPKKLKAEDSIIIDNCINFKTLPAYLSLSGSLKVTNCPLFKHMPSNLFVKYDVDVTSCASLKKLGEGAHIGRDFTAAFCENLKSLPSSMKIGRHLDLRGAKALKHFPDGIKIRGDLNLSGCSSLIRLPKKFNVGGSLQLNQCSNLTELPLELNIGHNLTVAHNSKLQQLPNDLVVGRSVVISHCDQIQQYPSGCNVGFGINLSHNPQLTKLPENWVVNGNLNLSHSPALEEVPEGIRVKGTLDLKECHNLKTLGNGIEILGDLLMYGCRSVTQLPNELIVTEKLLLEKCQSLTHFPEGLVIGGSLILKDCESLIYFPKQSFIGGLLDLTGCHSLGTRSDVQSLEELTEVLEQTSNNDVAIWYPSHILNPSDVGQLLAKLAELLPESLGGDKDTIPLYQFLKQFMGQNLQSRGGKKFVVGQVNELIEFLQQNNDSLGQIAWMNQLAEQYLEHCVNQRVNGFMGMMAWVAMAKAPEIGQKVTAASYLYAFELVNRYVGGGLGYDNHYEDAHFNGNEVHAEAANLMMIRVKHRLVQEGLIQEDGWPGVPTTIAYANTVEGWVDQHFEPFYQRLKTNLFNTDITKTLMLDMATQNLPNIQVWGRIAYPKLVHRIEAEYHPEAVKTKKKALQLLTAIDESLISKYLEANSRDVAINEIVKQVDADSKVVAYEAEQYLMQSSLFDCKTVTKFQEALATLYQQLGLDEGIEQKIAQAVRKQTDLDVPSANVEQTKLVQLDRQAKQTASLV